MGDLTGSNGKGSKKLLWIGWDGADWEHINPMLDAGLLPTLKQFVNQGTMGNLATMNPMLSPMLWNSAATGKYPDQHGIHGFVEPDLVNGGSRPFSSHSRKCKAVWNICSQSGLKSNVVNWWASHPAEKIDGCVVSNLISGVDPTNPVASAAENLIHPQDRAARYLKNRVLPSEITPEQLLPFCPNAHHIDQETDSRLAMLAKVIAEMLTTHAVATDIMEHEPWDFMAVYYTAIDHFSHGFMGYHPPRMPNVSEQDFEMYKDVVTGCYRFSDMMLERLLSLCDDDTTVVLCSDHGFQSRDLRPLGMPREPAGPAIWHREYGILAMHGPNIKRDALIHGANLIDIAPTLLTVLGLQVGADMQGRPLLEAFENPPEVEYIPSWEDVPGDDGMQREAPDISPEQASELVKQFVALGYIEDPGESREKQATSARVECTYNLARSLIFTGQPQQARDMLSDISHEFPWETRFIVQWIAAANLGGYNQHCVDLIESAYDLKTTPSLQMVVMWCDCKLRLQQIDDNVRATMQNLVPQVKQPMVLMQLARLFLRLRDITQAKTILAGALEIQHENALARMLIARIHYIEGDFDAAIDAALASLALNHRNPRGHLLLAMALTRSGQNEKALTAITTALKISEDHHQSHRWAAVVHHRLGNAEEAAHHRQRGNQIAIQNQASTYRDIKRHSRATQTFPIPEYKSEAQRFAQLDIERPPQVDQRARSGQTRVIVSGLPRSGTSLMMQMLEAGGLPAKTDGQRVADVDNPKGYYEWEDIKRIKHDFRILSAPDLDKKAIKAISMLLPDLPTMHDYKVIFLTRQIEEVVASQVKMLDNSGQQGGDLNETQMAQELAFHRRRSLAWLKQNPRAQHIEISYSDLVKNPQSAVAKIVELLGTELLPNAQEMAGAVDRTLYRQRKQPLTS